MYEMKMIHSYCYNYTSWETFVNMLVNTEGSCKRCNYVMKCTYSQSAVWSCLKFAGALVGDDTEVGNCVTLADLNILFGTVAP